MTWVLTKVRNESNDARVVALCDQMTRRFGGIEGFVKVWESCMAKDLEKGGFAALRHLSTVLRLAQFCEQRRLSPAAMSEAELEAAIQALGGEVPTMG